MKEELSAIGEQLRTQDNRSTMNPMFCVQKKKRDVGYDSEYAIGKCWHNFEDAEETIYDDDANFTEPEGKEWGEFGYVDRWETVMVAFTENGCNEYLARYGHNVKASAFRGEVRIFVQSFNRCPEMIAIREALMGKTAEKWKVHVVKYIIYASIYPGFWIAVALSSIGEPRLAPDYPTWTGTIVFEIAAMVVPIAAIAFMAGKAAGKSNDA